MYVITNKFFSKDDGLFHIEKSNNYYPYDKQEGTFEKFEDFYKATRRNLKNADLLDYDFINIDLKEYNIERAKISSETMRKIGLYNDNIFKLITSDRELSTTKFSNCSDLTQSRIIYPELIEVDDFVLCYISDLHLNHKLLKKFNTQINQFELERYLRDIVLQLSDSLPKYTQNYSVVFVGDISYNFEVFKLFFKIYKENIPYVKTFVILGNHELWDTSLNEECTTIEQIIEKYRLFLNSLGNVFLLENEIYFPNDRKRIYTYDEILAFDKNKLRKKFICNPYAIFGGIGYAGLNEEYNANVNMYRTKCITRDQEKKRSEIVSNMHKILSDVAKDNKVFFVTHMPKKDWSSDNYNKNWVYISGHTHRNCYIEDEDKKVYEDNQVGYLGNSFSFKYIIEPNTFDIFQDYPDGIYTINRQQYKLFYLGMGCSIEFNRVFEKLFMIKRNGSYCFLMKVKDNEYLKFLNGGNYKNTDIQDLNYFYENLDKYSKSINAILDPYLKYQKQISNEIKRMGGSGYIHGCIVDIDFYNHLYINPLDASITPYYATDIQNKWVYKNLISLLKTGNVCLYENYVKLLADNNSSLVAFGKNLEESDKTTYVKETDIYKVSKIIKDFQYTAKNNIVRLWNKCLENNASIENGKIFINQLISPEERIKTIHNNINVKKSKRIQSDKRKKESDNFNIQVKSAEKKQMYFDNYVKRISNINKNIKVITYTGSKEKAEFKCLACGHQWSTRADRIFNRNCKCPNCKL